MTEKEINELKKKLTEEEHHSFGSLLELVTVLRSAQGCHWDREQTHKSIRMDLIEETYEVIEAIDTDSPTLMCEELGDVLLQVAFHAELEREAGHFSMDDVTDGICAKLIHRHPHVFADVSADTSEKVLDNWDKIKKEEKGRKTAASSMESVPPALPALMRAQKVGKVAAKNSFDFPDTDSAFEKIGEETREVREALDSGDGERIAEELGDLLFAVVNVCRKAGVDAELALTRASDKFVRRFTEVERCVSEQNLTMPELKMEELDAIWDKIKHKNG